MGDSRYEQYVERVLEHGIESLGEIDDDGLIQALAALAARAGGQTAYLANVLASEAMNRLARAHAAVMNSGVALVGVNLDGVGVFANPAAEELLGWTQGELRGMHIHTLVHADAGGECSLEESLEAGEMHGRARSIFTRKNGAEVPVEFTVTPVLRDGEREGAVIAFHAAAETSASSRALGASADTR